MAAAKLKNWFKDLSPRKKLFLGLGGAFSLIIIYLFFALLNVDPAELKLAELKNSFEKEKICHESCSNIRQQAIEIIVDDLIINSNSRTSQRLKDYFLNDDLKPQFRMELVKILRLTYNQDSPPDYVKEYLADSTGDPVVQASIINSFHPSSLNPEVIETALPLDYYFQILTSQRNLLLKEAVVSALSNYPDKKSDFSVSQLMIIKKIGLDPETNKHFRASLILLLGDYYPLFPTETDLILKTIYSQADDDDTISRAFAADILNRLANTKLVIPEISAPQWDEYYNN